MHRIVYSFLLGVAAWLAGGRALAQPATRRLLLDVPALGRQLAAPAASPLRLGDPTPTYHLLLPTPTGECAFVLTETHVVPATDAAARQRLRTFLGYAVGQPTQQVSLLLTPTSLRADFDLDGQAVSLRPAAPVAPGAARPATYEVREVPAAPAPPCGVAGGIGGPRGGTGARFATQPAPYSYGTQVRTIRYAIVVTNEYFTANGGTNAAVEQAVVAVINQLSGLYLRELSVRFELAKPTSGAYYFAPAGAVSNQNLSNVITSVQTQFSGNTYDLGHCFHDSGGGVANVGTICNGSYKAGGWSGVGTSGNQHILAHEMGHQHGADHTFAGNCGGVPAGSDLEPGGGATIMAYAAVCGAQTLTGASNDDNHFNARSLDQMRRTIAAAVCPTTTTSANQMPTVNAGSSYVIPRSTPFVLTATGTDPDGQTLYYTWDQFDYSSGNHGALGTIAGNAGLAGINDPEAPLFRPRPPQTANSRTFPALTYILNNRNQPPDLIGEALPAVGRDMHFTVTARDWVATGGTHTTDNLTLTVAPAAGPFALTNLNVPALLIAGQPITVTWSVNGTDQAPVSTSQVRVLLSTDGGSTFSTVLAAATANDGTETLTLPAGLSTTRGRLRLEAVGNIYFDINNADFTIGNCNLADSQLLPATALTAPAGSSALYLLQPPFSTTQFTNSGSTQVQGTLTGASPRAGLSQVTGGSCASTPTVSTYYAAVPFVPDAAGPYTISAQTSFTGLLLRLYQGNFNSANSCQNLLASSIGNPLTTPALSPGLTYTLVVSTSTAALPSPAAYALTFTGGAAYAPLTYPGYDYQYVVVNAATSTVAQVRDEPDLRTLPTGSYQVYGFLVQGGYDATTLVGRSLSSVQAGLAGVAPCGRLSTNSRPVTITAGALATLPGQAPGCTVAAYPNPVAAVAALTVQVQAATAQMLDLQLCDALGRVVLRRQAQVPAGSSQLALPEVVAQPGLYLLLVRPAAGPVSWQKILLK